MKKIPLVVGGAICVAILGVLLLSISSNARTTELCTPIYENVEKIVLSYEDNVTSSLSANWDKVHTDYIERYKDFMSQENIDFVFSKTPPRLMDKHEENTVYFNVNYTYLDQKEIKEKLPSDILMTWIEVLRYKNKEEEPSKLNSEISYTSIEPYKYPAGMIGSKAMFALQIRLCSVMRSTAGKQCTDRKAFHKNKLVPIDTQCLRLTSD